MIIYFVHIPRTGGTSFGRWLKSGSRKKQFRYEWTDHKQYSAKKHKALLKRDKVIAVTIMRDPVDLAASFYSYIKRSPAHTQHKLANSMSFNEWIEKHMKINLFTKFLNNKPLNSDFVPSVVTAVKTLESFDYVLDTHYLKRGVKIMCKKENINHPFDVHINGFKKPPINVKNAQRIKTLCSLDYELITQAAEHIRITH